MQVRDTNGPSGESAASSLDGRRVDEPTGPEWEAERPSLVARGLLDKALAARDDVDELAARRQARQDALQAAYDRHPAVIAKRQREMGGA